MKGDYRQHDRIGRLEPRNIFADPVLLARAIPGLLQQFHREVPAEYRTDNGVRCVCGNELTTPRAQITACGCGRHFLRIKEKLLCANPHDESAH